MEMEVEGTVKNKNPVAGVGYFLVKKLIYRAIYAPADVQHAQAVAKGGNGGKKIHAKDHLEPFLLNVIGQQGNTLDRGDGLVCYFRTFLRDLYVQGSEGL
jgi:hypothetical protein